MTQDTGGPITRTITDAAKMLTVMTGYDPADPATAWNIGHAADYTAFLNANALRTARIGVLRTLFGSGPGHAEVNRVMEKALALLQAQGATLVEIQDPFLDSGRLINNYDVQPWEFKRVSISTSRVSAPRPP